ncbi:Transducin/WD40 repeat-like superfamily protein, putative isoform 2 [Capsicum annuum]|uniref:KIN14B-interacting protein At4g14310 n=1 Tax=Capsicum annuum TaxID=4072 RepID=UPI001FB10D4A|nr:KIN14B-interacting protein At4g14310 [Capsicum annuum]KAF3625347.1 Transducin/WD40 repeat-like superfamily protein, putative isoform 2 [Capsicum annuum]
MSTAASVRRLKDRGGAGVKITVPQPSTTRSSTPLSTKSAAAVESLRRSTGKENPRPSSRVRAATASINQKPTIRAMPRIDKAATAVDGGESRAEPRARWSSSSVPRGRSSSPSEFTKTLSDIRKTSRVSGSSRVVNEKMSENGKRVLKEMEKSGEISGKFDRKVSKFCDKEEVNSSSISRKSSVVSSYVKNTALEELKLKSLADKSRCIVDSNVKNRGLEEVKLKSLVEKSGNVDQSHVKNCGLEELKLKSLVERSGGVVESYVKNRGLEEVKLRSLAEKSGKDLRLLTKSSSFSGASKEKCENEQGKVGLSVNKYPSKLHEKLAFLEGKVKRIATDIKRTKEMLDMNNPDSSKLIISDIQEKISGIEKAMGKVVDGDGKVGLLSSSENESVNADVKISGIEKAMCNIVVSSSRNDDMNIDEKEEAKPADVGKISVKGLNVEELEARLFPHHKLLRERTSLKTLLGCTNNEELESAEIISEVKPEKKSVNPIDENPIAVEFLASLSKEQSNVTTRCEHAGLQISNVQDVDDAAASENQSSSSKLVKGKESVEHLLASDERLESFDAQENKPEMLMEEETEDSSICELNEIGRKTSTGGWFVSEGESVLLTHDDSSCSFYDIVHCEEKAEYKPPVGVSSNMWRDCWIVRAPGVDGSAGRYVVAASAGNSMDSGFCSWDFYSKDVRAFHVDDGFSNTRTALAPLPNNPMYRRNALSSIMSPQNQQWWYKPCGPLIVSGASCQRMVRTYDIRDGEQVLKWDLQRPMLSMDYSSPLQWRSRGKVVIAESEGLSLWDVNSISPQALLSVSSSSRQISALHVNNTDAELGGGVRQRVSSSEAEGNDGVFCTSDSINVLDFRHPSGIGLKIPKIGANVQSVFARGDSLYLGCTTVKSAVKRQVTSQIQQFSLRKQRLCNTYVLPESNAHSHYMALTQVWGNSNLVMGVCGLGLFVFDTNKDDALLDQNNGQNLREAIGPDDLYSPSFDYLSSRVLIISRDRPAMWRYMF